VTPESTPARPLWNRFLRPPADADDLVSMLMAEIEDREDHEEHDNLDETYPPFSLDMDRDSLLRRRDEYTAFVSTHRTELFEVLGLWEDEGSRALFIQLMLFRALGHEKVRLDSNTPAFWRAHRQARAMSASPSNLRDVEGGGSLACFDIPQPDTTLHVDCLRANVLFTFLLKQYHFNRDGFCVGPREGDHVVDAGACFGDTAVDFSHAVGSDGRVHSFDVLNSHLQVLRHNIAQNAGGAPIIVHPHGLSDVAAAGVTVHSAVNPGFSVDRGTGIPLRRLDDLVDSGEVERVDLIKMDVEGHEGAILRGARATISRFRPRLAISLYHRWDDYVRLPLFIRDLNLGYRFYLENYTISDGETIMYCIA
jgi:FkbM family methyltransferase